MARTARARDDVRPDGMTPVCGPKRRQDDLPRAALRIVVRKVLRIAVNGSVVAPVAHWFVERVLAHPNAEIRQMVRDEYEEEMWMQAVHYQRDLLAAKGTAWRSWWRWRRPVTGLKQQGRRGRPNGHQFKAGTSGLKPSGTTLRTHT